MMATIVVVDGGCGVSTSVEVRTWRRRRRRMHKNLSNKSEEVAHQRLQQDREKVYVQVYTREQEEVEEEEGEEKISSSSITTSSSSCASLTRCR
jgi:NAD-dependent SIR2 family protein deacetylase